MTEMEMTAIVRKLSEEFFDKLEKATSEERLRRRAIAELVGEINEKLYELSGLLTNSDSLRFLNNLTGEVMSDLNDWDEPEDGKLYLAPELAVEIAVERKPRRCPGAPADCHECDKCPWD